MSTNETRLLTAFVLVLAVAGTVFHAVLRWDEAPVPQETTVSDPPPVPRESALLAFGAGAQSFEPASPAGSWRFVWQGTLSALLLLEEGAEALPGGYFVTASTLRDEGPLWTLEVVLSPWQVGLVGPPGAPADSRALAAALGAAPTPLPKKPPTVSPSLSPPAAAPPAPAPAPLPSTGDIVLLGSFGDGAGRHWWFKEKATDRVFEVPGADDWSLVQADGAAIVLQRAGRQYRVELTP